ncbi:putative secreted protein [Streptomyces davaonensis JCM 4913]|uniref:Putative secreted protein n=1 Tax=Streptomyces davaonensis (strain DSM 101723 / JCM 4913 / KCC S-0913 / 768) TaxID=1214101 RepID=K4RCY1_STRDJ|nr:hypothetical protein [Streptomyces davaonensis]CCK31272.1 putative secreted protein [Streptomyces davaonensis JCM 4913]
MAISLGVRISGLLVAGALAVGTAAACGGGGGEERSGGSAGTRVSGGGSGGGGSGGTDSPKSSDGSGSEGSGGGMPTWRPSDEEGSGNVSGGGNGSGGNDSGGTGPGGGDRPGWLRPGPRSPNTDTRADAATVYDDLAANPQGCKNAAGKVPGDSEAVEWRVLRALAAACQAVQGEGGDWSAVTAEYAALQGRVTGCKSSAAYAVLGDVLRFHQRNPSATVRLAPPSGGGGAVCDFRIVSVDVGGDGKAKPHETITITVAGMYFDKRELPGGASPVTIAGAAAYEPDGAEEPDFDAEPPDQLTFQVEVPAPEGAVYPLSATVTIDHAREGTVTLPDAFTLVAPDSVGPSPGVSPSAVASPSPSAPTTTP